jgi:Ankyrin repeats (many copies)
MSLANLIYRVIPTSDLKEYLDHVVVYDLTEPFMNALEFNPDAAQVLLESPARINPNCVLPNGNTALTHAILTHQFDLAKLLIGGLDTSRPGANVDARDRNGTVPIVAVVKSVYSGDEACLQVAKKLLETCDANRDDIQGVTALYHLACNRAKPTTWDFRRFSDTGAIIAAARVNWLRLELAALLMDHGGDPTYILDDETPSPRAMALSHEDFDLYEILNDF